MVMFSKFRPLALGLVFLLSACATDTVVDLTAPSFINQPVYRMNVADIRVNDQFEPPFDGNHVEHQFPTSPARAVGIWANDRLKAAGRSGVMEVTIRDASVTQKKGKKFDTYDIVMEVDLRLYDGGQALALAEAHSRVTLSRGIDKNASITKHEDFFAQMTRDVMKSLDVSLEGNLRDYFGQYILSDSSR